MLDKGSFDSEPLRVMAFIEQTDVIRKILEHLRLWGARRKPVPRANAPPVTHVAEDVESYHHHPIRLVNNVPALTSPITIIDRFMPAWFPFQVHD